MFDHHTGLILQHFADASFESGERATTGSCFF